MIGLLLEGVSLGFVLAIMVGPVFFMLINTSIKKGFKPAVFLAAGVVLSDAFFILIALFGSRIGNFNQFDYPTGITGGLLLITFGLISIFKKPEVKAGNALELPDDSKTLLIDTGKGFMMNTLNPFVLVFWIGVITAMQAGKLMTTADKAVFFTAVLITVFATDLAKAFLASKLKKLLTFRRMQIMNRISGTGLILFGLQLMYKTVKAGF